MRRKKERDRKNTALGVLLLLLIPLYGGYYDFSTLLAGAALAGILAWEAARGGGLKIPAGPEAWCLYGICACRFLTVPFAVSPGMAFTGGLRALAWVLFFLAAAAYTPGERRSILDAAAYEGALLSLASSAGFLYARLRGTGPLNGRDGGFFQYANAWGLFQLVCLLLLLLRKERKRADWPAMGVLLCGVFFSGSRGALLLLFFLALAYGLGLLARRRSARPLLAGAGALALALGLTALLSGGMVLERLGAVSLSSSTLNGRLLYALDGLRLLAECPLGAGRGGFFYWQALRQTGVYTTRFLHNEYLQAAVDGGVFCGLLTLGLAASLVFRRGAEPRERAAAFTVCAHALIDFDFQFTALVFLLLLCGSGGRTVRTALPRRGAATLGAALALALGFFSLVYYLDFSGRSAAAYRLFPWDLSVAENALQVYGSPEEARPLAGRIAASTDLSLVAWDCLYQDAARRGDGPGMAGAKYRYLRLNRYRGGVYRDFASLLERLWPRGSPEELRQYRALAQGALEQLKEVRENTSPLALRIADRPDWSFEEEVRRSLERTAGEIDTLLGKEG